MSYSRYMCKESIRLDLTPSWQTGLPLESDEYEAGDEGGEGEESEDGEEDEPDATPIRKVKEIVMREMADLLFASGKISNFKKFANDLVYVERRSTSAIGEGVVIPHLRCLHTKSLIMGFARYSPEFEFGAPDNQGVQLFIPMIAPTYDDRLYLRIYRSIAKAFLETAVKQLLLDVQEPGEVIRIFNDYFQ